MKKKITRLTLSELSKEMINVEIKEAISMLGGGEKNVVNPLIDYPHIESIFGLSLNRTKDMEGGVLGEAVVTAPKPPKPSPRPVPSWENTNDFFWNSLMANHNQPYNVSEYENSNYQNSDQYENSNNNPIEPDTQQPPVVPDGNYGGYVSGGGNKKPSPPSNPYKSIIFDQSVPSTLKAQIIDLFDKSRTLRFILDHFIKGRDNLKIRVGSANGAMEAALENDNFSITINPSVLGANGEFNFGFKGSDNVGFEYNGNVYQTFAAALAHEALHIKHFQIWNDSVNRHNGDINAVYQDLKNRYSEKFADVFYENKNGFLNIRRNIGEKEHALFRNYNLPLFQKVVDEYKQGKKEDVYRAYEEIFGQ